MKNLHLWFSERFPGVSVFSAYLVAAASLAWARQVAGMEVTFVWVDLWVGLGATFHFLLLRVFDEHKDYENDLVAHPDRVLQKGLVTLTHLKILGGISFVGSLLLTFLFASSQGLWLWGLMMLWTFLMAKEFFIEKFLRPRLFLYSFTHLAVLPFMAMWMFAFTLENPVGYLSQYWVFFAFVLANGLIYDVVRKTRGQDEPAKDELMFTELWSRKKVCMVIFSLVAFSAGCFLYLVLATNNWIVFAATGLGVLLSVGSILQFFKEPKKKTRKGVEGATALYSLIVYLGLTLALVFVGS